MLLIYKYKKNGCLFCWWGGLKTKQQRKKLEIKNKFTKRTRFNLWLHLICYWCTPTCPHRSASKRRTAEFRRRPTNPINFKNYTKIQPRGFQSSSKRPSRRGFRSGGCIRWTRAHQPSFETKQRDYCPRLIRTLRIRRVPFRRKRWGCRERRCRETSRHHGPTRCDWLIWFRFPNLRHSACVYGIESPRRALYTLRCERSCQKQRQQFSYTFHCSSNKRVKRREIEILQNRCV